MAPLEERLASARDLAKNPHIRVTALEDALGTRYTAETLAVLTARFPRVRFAWLMGADNLIQLTRWKHWTHIFNLVVIAVFDRPSYSLGAVAAKAARRHAASRLAEKKAGSLLGRRPPAWVFLHNRLNPQSATDIRARSRE